MAEFQEVMRQWNRRFESEKTLVDDEIVGIDALWLAMDDPEKIESMVMSWAAEHPEPVYPTWAEYFEKTVPHGNGETALSFALYVMQLSIPADVAQKLGIEPKEG